VPQKLPPSLSLTWPRRGQGRHDGLGQAVAMPVWCVWCVCEGEGGRSLGVWAIGNRRCVLHPHPNPHAPHAHSHHTPQAAAPLHGRVPGGQARGCGIDGGYCSCSNHTFFFGSTSPSTSFSRPCQGGGGGGRQHGARQPGGGAKRRHKELTRATGFGGDTVCECAGKGSGCDRLLSSTAPLLPSLPPSLTETRHIFNYFSLLVFKSIAL